MNGMKITVEKTHGGSGSDAWSSSFAISDSGCSVNICARGESRNHARANLAHAINRMVREANAVTEELSN